MPEPFSLHPQVREPIVNTLEQLRDNGTLLRPAELDASYHRFRDRFGPERLATLDGEELLNTMHLHGNRATGQMKPSSKVPGRSFDIQ